MMPSYYLSIETPTPLVLDGWIKGDRLEGEERGDHIKVRREKKET